MSDVEDDHYTRREEDEEDSDVREEEEGGREARHKKKHQRRKEEDEEEEEEEDDEEDEDGDEEDEDEDPGEARGQKRRKRQKRSAVNRFLDLVADVDDDEEEEEEEEDYGKDDFLEEGGHDEGDLDDINRRAADHARLDRRERELTDQDLARIAEDVARRYKPTAQRYTGDMNEIPQRLLMPSVQDANLWQVRVRPGRERDIVFSLMRRAMEQEFTARPLQILSAFQRDSLPGMIYVESHSSKEVMQAINGLVGVFPSRGVTLVPIEEMASLLQIKKKDTTITPGSWVRIKRGKYQGDLAQVIDIAENGEEVGLKFVPRIDLSPKDDILSADGKKRKKIGGAISAGIRPPQRFFNYEEVIKAYGRRAVAKRNQVYVFSNDTFKDGYIEKDFKLSALILDNVNPTLDEIMKFTRQEDGTEHEGNVDLSIIAEAAKKEAITVLQPGDHVEVFEGEQTGVHGVVESIANDVVTLRAVGVEIEGQKVDVPARSVRKRFKPGDHVKVMSGHNADETGLVVSVMDNVVTFLSDMSMQEVSVFSKDLRVAAEVGASTNIVGNYELHDLVQLDQQTVGVIFKTERDSFRVLDQNGQVRLVQPHQISMRRDSTRAIATDAEGHPLRIQDNVKEVDGLGRKGQVLHIYQSFYAFLFNREIAENAGVFVTRARSLVSQAPKTITAKMGNIDLSKQNPSLMSGAMMGGMVGSQIGRGPRDRLIGVTVAIIKGPQKGYVGTIKDTNGNIARVELQTNNKVISIDKMKLRRRLPGGHLEDLEGGRRLMPPPPVPNTGSRTTNPYSTPGGHTPVHLASSGTGRTPAWARTPNPFWDTRTPGGQSRTPNPYADGGRTPAWNAAAQTPAWNTSSRTPNPYTSQEGMDGGRTPRWNSSSSRTPMRPAETSAWAASSPVWTASYDSAPTPYSAATPAAAPTPYANDDHWGEGTPAANHPTWGYGGSAETPAAAPTPGAFFREDEEELSWIVDPELPIKKNLIVKVTGSTASTPPWADGEHEGKTGIVESVLERGKGGFVHIRTIPDHLVLHVPQELIEPCHPEQPGEKVIPLEGPAKGTVCSVLRFQGGMVDILSDGTTSMLPIDKVVRYREY